MTHGLYHMTNADVGGPECADLGLHGESGMVSQVVMMTQQNADAAVGGRLKGDSACQK